MTKSYFNIREALEVGTDKIVDAYKKATPGEVNELSAEEKKLVNQMYDKKGNLTPLGKKVMNHGKKPGDKNYIESVNEEDDAPASPDEAGMAMDQAKFIGYVAEEIMEYIQGNNEFPEWMQNKLTALHEKAKGMHAVMAGKYNESVEVNEMGPRHTSKSMKYRFGGAVDSKKFDAYKKFVKQHNVDEPTVRMVIDNPNDAESKRMMKITNIAKAVELRKAAMKESVQEAKVECPKCKGEGCDHCDGKGYHMTEAKQKNWMVTVTKPINKLKKGMKVVVPARNTAEAIKKALKKMGENPAAIGSGHLDVKLDEGLEEKYRAPTKAEIEADKKKDRAGKSRPSMSAKSVNKKQYGNMMGRLKEKELEEAKFTPKEIKMAIGIASDPRYKGGNMTGATKAIDKIKKGLSDYPQVAAVLKRQNESVDLEEKLQVSDGMKKWIEDFQKSDAPQFEGMDKNERREMAIAAYLAAKRRDKKED